MSSNSALIARLTGLRQQVDSAKGAISRLEGERAQLLAQLRELGYESPEQAAAARISLETQAESLASRLQKGLDELCQKFPS